MDLKERGECLEEWIKDRRESGRLTKCRFYITTPKCVENEDIYRPKDPSLLEVIDILERNGTEYGCCDTVPGAYNLNRDFFETEIMDCAVEFCGVYPADWNPEDAARFEEMENNGDIMVIVTWHNPDGSDNGMNR